MKIEIIDWGINIIFWLLLCGGLVTLCLSIKMTRCFLKSGIIKMMSNILIILFAVIAFFFSIHANILSQHDDKEDGLFWFNVRNIINFPIEQLSNNNSQYKKNEIKFPTHNINNNAVPKFVFVIDKTLSTELEPIYKQKEDLYIKNFIDEIKKDLRNTPSLLKPIENNKSYIDLLKNTPSDLLLVGCIQQLYKLYGNNIEYEVLIYNGEKENEKKYQEFQHIGSKKDTKKTEEFGSFLQKYQNIKNPTGSDRKTNLNKIISELDHNSYVSDSTQTIITIICDFYHEEETESFYKLDKSLYNLSKRPTICQLNLIELYGSKKNNAAIITRTMNLCAKYFKHTYLYKYEQRNIFNENSNDFSCYIASIMQIAKQSDSTKINFYYPFKQGVFSKTNQCEIKFPAGKYTLNIRNESTNKSTNNICISFKDKKNNSHFLLTDEHPIVERLGENDATYELTMNAENIPYNCFLEISSENNRNKTQFPLVFKELVPKTICYVLILIYTLAGLLFTASLWFLWKKHSICNNTKYPYLFCKINKKNNAAESKTKCNKSLFVLAFVSSVSLIIYYALNLWWGSGIFLCLTYILFIFFVLFLLLHLFKHEFELLHNDKICKRKGCLYKHLDDDKQKDNPSGNNSSEEVQPKTESKQSENAQNAGNQKNKNSK